LIKLYDDSFTDLQRDCRKKFSEPVGTVDHALTTATVRMLKMVLTNDPKKVILDKLEGEKLNLCLERLFLFAYAWGTGA
jgi:hypothetical protein